MVSVFTVLVGPIFLIPCSNEDVAAGIPAAIDLGFLIFKEFCLAGVVAMTPLRTDIINCGNVLLVNDAA